MKTAIIGAGAAGLAAAVFAARQNPKAEVTVLEGNERAGRKILSTGNGRCNLSNTSISPANYVSENPPFVEAALEGRGFDFVRDFFASIGVPLTLEDGRAYPRSMRAGSVVDALRFECARLGVDIAAGARVKSVEAERGRFLVDGVLFDRLVLATGGLAAPATGSDGAGLAFAAALGHKVCETYPALVQLRAYDSDRALRGIRAEAKVSAVIHGRCVREETGEVQFTDYGLSGVPVMQLSTLFRGNMDVAVDLLPERDFTTFVDELVALAGRCGGMGVCDFLGGYLHKNLTRHACLEIGLDPSAEAGRLTLREIKQLASALKNMRFHVVGTNSWPSAQTTRGGVDTREIDPRTMRSRLHGGLYFAGEIMDVCGDCGGYNLHWAWISGAAAGENAVR